VETVKNGTVYTLLSRCFLHYFHIIKPGAVGLVNDPIHRFFTGLNYLVFKLLFNCFYGIITELNRPGKVCYSPNFYPINAGGVPVVIPLLFLPGSHKKTRNNGGQQINKTNY
jgi:hypothetical protein